MHAGNSCGLVGHGLGLEALWRGPLRRQLASGASERATDFPPTWLHTEMSHTRPPLAVATQELDLDRLQPCCHAKCAAMLQQQALTPMMRTTRMALFQGPPTCWGSSSSAGWGAVLVLLIDVLPERPAVDEETTDGARPAAGVVVLLLEALLEPLFSRTSIDSPACGLVVLCDLCSALLALNAWLLDLAACPASSVITKLLCYR